MTALKIFRRGISGGVLKMADLVKYHIIENSEFEILTENGFKEFRGIIVGENREKLKITFNTGEYIICTPLHKIMIDEYDYVYAQSLGIGASIYGNKKITNIENIKNDDPVFEFLEIDDTHTYFANNILCHQCIIIDEAAHIEPHLMGEFWASVIPVISSSKKRTTKIFMVSTPKGTGNMFYEIFVKAQKGESDQNLTWHAETIYWHEIPGRGKLWKADMIEALHGDKLLFEQEFNCSFLESGDSAIDIELLNEQEQKCRDPEQVFEDGHYSVWRPPQTGHIYGMGVDVGEGIGRAASVVQVLDFTDLTDIHQVAVYTDRYVHPTRFADIINRIGRHYGCPPVLIERNNIGSETIAVLHEIHHYENIVSYDPSKTDDGEPSLRPGINSQTVVKYHGVMNLRYWLNSNKALTLYDIGTVQELRTFVRYPNGTWKKKAGENIFDDRVMSLVWALFILNDDIAERYYEIVETDDNGKPLKLAAYTTQQQGTFRLDPFFQQTPGAPLPSFFNGAPDDDMENMKSQGWQMARSAV